MDEPNVVDVLQELLQAEQCALAPAVFESTVFISRLSLDDERVARRLAEAVRRHGAALAEMILRRGGTPGPREPNLAAADLHYQELHHVLPRLIDDQQRLVDLYRRAVERLADDPEAQHLVTDILHQHERALEELRNLAARPATTAA